VFVVCSVACEYVSLRIDPRVCFIECFLSLLCSADEGERIVLGLSLFQSLWFSL
jgi:hypothetical protein